MAYKRVQRCYVIHISEPQGSRTEEQDMNEVTKLIASTLGVSMEDAAIWQDRIETWDEMDCSEWSELKMSRHIESFIGDWVSTYSHVAEKVGM
jgi:hypothetical protein